MNKPKHTPGPWIVQQDTLTGQRKITGAPYDENLFFGETPWAQYPGDRALADARLAAAAPQLAEAIVSMAKQAAREDWTKNFGEEEAREYADENWHEFLNHDAVFALRAAGYLNNENE